MVGDTRTPTLNIVFFWMIDSVVVLPSDHVTGSAWGFFWAVLFTLWFTVEDGEGAERRNGGRGERGERAE
jgi:hypothetical protein